MMTVQMDNGIATPSSRELAESLFKKNLKLEARLKKLAEAKLPSDPNIWLEIRENLEGIILADHDFSQKNECETALWQLHYRRIEEFRYHINSGTTSSSNNPKNNNQTNADRLKRIRGSFKVFLSEATGFYHELMLKIRSKYGLPLNGDNLVVNVKDENKAAEMKKGLMSCHRCLIYLGDLARYKGLYGEGEVVSREFGAASSYYTQALNMCPTSGNPHHQLGILATYSRDELLVVYRYFRSLAVDSPFTMARENLVIAFDKNRQHYSSLITNSGAKAPSAKAPPARTAGKGKGRGDRTSPVKEAKKEPVSPKEQEITMPEILKAFCVKFVRLNGILFTRTSLETFEEVFSSLMRDFQTLLSSGPEEELNFGPDSTENALLILRMVAILIYTVHNVKRESEGKSYAGVVQRNLLLQNAFTASFELVGQILKRCLEVKDATSSFYLSGILVYIEWLACHPDMAAGSDMDEKQATARSFFWNQCVSLLNRLVSSGLAPVETDKDVSCFFEMSAYDEAETGNRIALWEDFELRGFLPLVPAQVILDFSRKSEGGIKEKKARVERIFAAGQALTSVVQIGPMKIYFDPGPKKFVISKSPPETEVPKSSGLQPNGIHQLRNNPSDQDLFVEGEEDEVIVFQPNTFNEKPSPPLSITKPSIDFIQHSSGSGWDGTTSVPFSAPINGPSQMPAHTDVSLDLQNVTTELPPYASSSNWLAEKEALSTGLKELSIAENGVLEQRLQGVGGGLGAIQPVSFSSHIPAPVGLNNHNLVPGVTSEGYRHQLVPPYLPPAPIVNASMAMPDHLLPSATAATIMQSMLAGLTAENFAHQLPPTSQFPPAPAFSDKTALPDQLLPSTAAQAIAPSVLDFGVIGSDGIPTRFVEKHPVASKKNPVSRPVRHTGPPPGFNGPPPGFTGPPPGFGAPVKWPDESITSPVRKDQPFPPQTDDYGWLDGYQSSANHKVAKHVGYNNFTNAVTGDMLGASFGFAAPVTQVSGAPAMPVNGNNKWHDFQLFEPAKLHNNEHQVLPQGETQQGLLAEQPTAQSLWSGRYFV
ncbi:Telomerase activating protein Est1 [Rhynchospora pubera]|uniref:Telomerase activating protein Est1 n=1 Tax=Rhynchospora pubera TaxID=906938 RepID=A0AAV8CHZ1_9POAL|nr:Telomerase activating protein Est1 [Rhynchospora pubera]